MYVEQAVGGTHLVPSVVHYVEIAWHAALVDYTYAEHPVKI